MGICEKSKIEICLGLEGSTPPPSDGELRATSSGVDPFALTSRCPFSGQSSGQCPFSANGTAATPGAPYEACSANPQQWDDGATSQALQATSQAPMRGRILGNAM